MEISLTCLCIKTLEVWKCGNVEMWKYVWIVFIDLNTLEVWKCGNVEMWKCGNMSSLSLSKYSGSVEMWKCGNMSSLSLANNSGSVEMWKYVLLVFI